MSGIAMDKKQMERLEKTLKAIGNANRMQILRYLAQKGPTSVKDMAEAIKMSQPACSVHIKVLYEAGLLQRERRGNHVFYSLDKKALESWQKEFVKSILE